MIRETKKLKVSVLQDGARLHYGVPLSLQRQDALEQMICPFFLKKESHLLRYLSKKFSKLNPSIKRMSLRRCDEIHDDLTVTSPLLELKLLLGRSKFSTSEEYYYWRSELEKKWVSKKGFRSANMLFCFTRSIHPELIIEAKSRGLNVIGDQFIAPAEIEKSEALIQSDRWPGWEDYDIPDYEFVSEVEKSTWPHLNHITCASKYVSDSMVSCGVSQDRISVIPYPIDSSSWNFINRTKNKKEITVGFVGKVGLRKGAPYFIETAKKMAGGNLRFVMIGPVTISKKIAEQNSGVVDFVGAVSRAEVIKWLSKFDIFYFPSTCEGSAGVLSEAMATGLPIVTSHNSGSCVTHGQNGYIVNYDAIDQAVEKISALASDGNLRQEFGMNARKAIESNHIDSYGKRLADVMLQQL